MITQTTGATDGLNTITFSTEDAAELTVEATTGLILNIEVNEDHRGEGLARQLFEYATTVMDIYHVPTWGMTPEGAAFAEAVGGETMDDEQAAQILDLDLEQILEATGEAAS